MINNNNNQANDKTDEQTQSNVKNDIDNQENENQWPTEFVEVDGGMWDGYGCYVNPDGSFWNPNGIYFNKDGIDFNGGFYDEEFEYHPGPNWNDALQCYECDYKEGLNSEIDAKITEDMQNKLSEEYDKKAQLFKTAENKNFDVANMFYEEETGKNYNEPDYDNDLINSWLEANLIQMGDLKIDDKECKESKEDKEGKTPNKSDNKSECKAWAQPNDENICPNNSMIKNVSFGDNLQTSFADMGTPFKTKTSEILKQGGTPFQSISVKKVTLTTPRNRDRSNDK